MKYYFKFGRGKQVVLNGNDTFEALGLAILDAYHMMPEHLFSFEFANGETTNSASPLGPMDDYGKVPIDSKISARHLLPGETVVFVYDYSSDYRRKIKLADIK